MAGHAGQAERVGEELRTTQLVSPPASLSFRTCRVGCSVRATLTKPTKFGNRQVVCWVRPAWPPNILAESQVVLLLDILLMKYLGVFKLAKVPCNPCMCEGHIWAVFAQPRDAYMDHFKQRKGVDSLCGIYKGIDGNMSFSSCSTNLDGHTVVDADPDDRAFPKFRPKTPQKQANWEVQSERYPAHCLLTSHPPDIWIPPSCPHAAFLPVLLFAAMIHTLSGAPDLAARTWNRCCGARGARARA